MTAFVIQRPTDPSQFDMSLLEAEDGGVEFLLNSPPFIYDQEQVAGDVDHMADVIEGASDQDFFVWMGGNTVSNILFGMALQKADVDGIMVGLYQRDRNASRGGESKYLYRKTRLDK